MPRKPPPQEPGPPPARRFTDRLEHATVLLPGLSVRGSIEGGDSVDLGGRMEGDVRIEGLFRVREKGHLRGSVKATQVLIEGELSGEKVEARDKLELRSRARVEADIAASSVAMADGCQFHGKVDMREGGRGAVTFTEKRTGDGS